MFLSVRTPGPGAVAVAKGLKDLGFEIIATAGTHAHLGSQGIEVELVKKVREAAPTASIGCCLATSSS